MYSVMMTTIVIILLLITSLLAVPITLRFRLSRYEAVEGKVTLQWLFGLVKVDLSNIQPDEESGEKKKVEHSGSWHSSKMSLSRAVRQQPFRNRLIRFVSDIWHAIKREDFRLYLRLGLGDPADTGQLWAIIGPLSGILFTLEDAEITVEPDFFDAIFEFESSGTICLIPLQLLTLVGGLLLSPVIWRGLRIARNHRTPRGLFS